MAAPRKKRPSSASAKPTSAAPASDQGFVNLEMKGDRLKVFSLQTLLTNKRNKETREVARLGDVLLPWYEKTVSKPNEKLAGISELWETHVPPTLLERTRLVGFHRGTLTVAVDSAPVRAEIDAQLRGGLLRKLQTESRGALYRVKTQIEPSFPSHSSL